MEIDSKALIAVLAGSATDEERVLVDRWRASSPAHEADFRLRQHMWALLGSLEAPSPTDTVQDERRSLPPGIVTGPPVSLASWPSRSARAARGIRAAVLVVTIFVFAVSILHFQAGRAGFEPLAAADVATGPGEIQTVQLRDGTVVRLGPESRLGFSEVHGPRDVFIDGQAYFVVPGGQPDAFRVYSRNGQVAVVGTRFEVASRGEDVRVLVVEGEVEFLANEHRVSLRKGQAGTAASLAPPVVDSVADVYGETAWIGEFAAYEETPLSEIVTEFERRFGLEFEIVDPILASRTVSGTMRDQSVEDMAANVCIAVGAHCTFSPGRVRMEVDPPPPLLTDTTV